ncbi:MAG: NAD(P)H-binding protein [Bacillota bacterium]
MEGEVAGAAVMVEVGGTPARWDRKQDVGWGKMAAFDVVTGAFGFTGKHIAGLLLAMGRTVVTLTAHPERPHPFGDRVKALPLDFEDPRAMSEAMRGADTLYNTYWIRFERGSVTFERAVRNSEKLVAAARDAGVRRIVHISITNPSAGSPLPYFRGKALVEQAIRSSGIPYAIVRPTVIFGPEDILINNIAWLLRHFPLFPVFGTGDYRLQPVFVEDVAEIAVSAGRSDGEMVVDAAGPEVYSFAQLVQLIAREIRSRARIVHLAPAMAYLLGRVVGSLVGDVIITEDEIAGLMANLLVSSGAPTGKVRFSEWLSRNAHLVGVRYASELQRHYR